MGGKTDWVGKKLTSQIFPRGKKLTGQFFLRGKNGPAHSFPGENMTGEKTDRYTGVMIYIIITVYNNIYFGFVKEMSLSRFFYASKTYV